MGRRNTLDDVPVVIMLEGEPGPAEMKCAGCPAGGRQQDLLTLDPEGSGPDIIEVGSKTLSVCCKVDQVSGYFVDLSECVIFQRGTA